jgi:prepilin peptidase CpaA
MTVSIFLVLVGCLAAAYTDVRTRRIGNRLTGSLAIAAIVVHAFAGVTAVVVTLLILMVATALGSFVYARGGIGGGDVKLAIAASALLGYPLCIDFLLYSAIGGGLLAVAFILVRGDHRQSYARLLTLTSAGTHLVVGDRRKTLPYAVAFAFGAVTVALSQSVAPFLRISL